VNAFRYINVVLFRYKNHGQPLTGQRNSYTKTYTPHLGAHVFIPDLTYLKSHNKPPSNFK